MATKATRQTKYRVALEARGWKIAKSLSRRYIVMERDGDKFRLYLGKSGALRHGMTITGSVPVAGRFAIALLAEYDLAHPAT